MTFFEYISIATSLILSFSLARTLANIGPIFASQHRYWVHSLWVLGLLISHASLFWQIWLYQGVESWTLLEFFLLLMGPIMLLIGASLLVPVESVSDYRRYFESIRVPFYSVLIILNVHPVPLLYLLFDIALVSPVLVNALIVTFTAVVGLIFRKRAIDMLLVLLFFMAAISSMVANNDIDNSRALLEGLSS